MSHTYSPILVGVTSPVSEILLPSKTVNFPFRPMEVHGHQKIQSIGIGSKNSCKYKLMSNVCTPILVGVTSPVSEILLPSKTAKFPFDPWTIVHGHQKIQSIGIGSKNSCNYKLMSNVCTPILVGIASSVSEILLPSKTVNFPFLTMDYVHGHQKIQSIGISSKNSCNYKLMSNVCTPILVGIGSPVLEILLPSKTAKFPFLTMDYSPWSSKNSIDRNRLKKFMQL